MLTAIVVSIATTGVALAALILIFRRYKTLEIDEIMKIRKETGV
jgi:multicomponent Na+:H+ antiporter subunit C